MNDYLKIQEVAKKWGISERRIYNVPYRVDKFKSSFPEIGQVKIPVPNKMDSLINVPCLEVRLEGVSSLEIYMGHT